MLSVEVNIRPTLKYYNMKGVRMKVFRILKILLLYMHILDGITAFRIDVANGRCGSTIDLATYEQVYLDYRGEMLYNGECTYTFTNNDWNKEICIRKNWGELNNNCFMAFSYYIGQKNRYNDKSCTDFYFDPLCAKAYKVFASFKYGMSGGFGGISLSKAHVIIYLQTPPSTTYTPYNSYSDDGGTPYVTIALIVIFSGLVLGGCCICCARCWRQIQKPVPNQGRDPINNAHNQGRDPINNAHNQGRDPINNAPNQGFDRSLPNTTHERNGTQQRVSPGIPLNSNYDWGPPSYEECADQSNNLRDTSHKSGNQPHINPYTITTGTQDITEKEHGASDEMEPPPSYESLTSISHL